jgi:hypothetical protein
MGCARSATTFPPISRAVANAHCVAQKLHPATAPIPLPLEVQPKFILHMVLCLRMGHIGVGWGSAVDPKTGQTYWFNKETRKVQWEAGEQISRLALTKHLTEFVLVFVLVFVRFSSWHARLSGHAGLYSVTVRRIDSFEIDDEKPSMLRGAWRGWELWLRPTLSLTVASPSGCGR